MGLALLLLMASVVRGEMEGSINQTIRLQSGHIQIRAESYSEDKNSLAWEDLIEDPTTLANKIAAQPEVVLVTPRVLASGIINTVDESISVKIMGVDPTSQANGPFSEGIIEGNFIQADDREGFIIGKDLAEKYHLKTGDQIQLMANTAEWRCK